MRSLAVPLLVCLMVSVAFAQKPPIAPPPQDPIPTPNQRESPGVHHIGERLYSGQVAPRLRPARTRVTDAGREEDKQYVEEPRKPIVLKVQAPAHVGEGCSGR
jgi:hypothetical protein